MGTIGHRSARPPATPRIARGRRGTFRSLPRLRDPRRRPWGRARHPPPEAVGGLAHSRRGKPRERPGDPNARSGSWSVGRRSSSNYSKHLRARERGAPCSANSSMSVTQRAARSSMSVAGQGRAAAAECPTEEPPNCCISGGMRGHELCETQGMTSPSPTSPCSSGRPSRGGRDPHRTTGPAGPSPRCATRDAAHPGAQPARPDPRARPSWPARVGSQSPSATAERPTARASRTWRDPSDHRRSAGEPGCPR